MPDLSQNADSTPRTRSSDKVCRPRTPTALSVASERQAACAHHTRRTLAAFWTPGNPEQVGSCLPPGPPAPVDPRAQQASGQALPSLQTGGGGGGGGSTHGLGQEEAPGGFEQKAFALQEAKWVPGAARGEGLAEGSSWGSDHTAGPEDAMRLGPIA